MYAVECLQASTAPISVIPGLFPHPALLIVKEWSLELYEWASDVSQDYLELVKFSEQFTFFQAISAGKLHVGETDCVLVSAI